MHACINSLTRSNFIFFENGKILTRRARATKDKVGLALDIYGSVIYFAGNIARYLKLADSEGYLLVVANS